MEIQERVPLAKFTTFDIGGVADYFVVAKSPQDIIDAVSWAHSVPTPGVGAGMPFFMLGMGANILIGDKGFRGLVIKNEARQVSELHPSPFTLPPENEVFLTADSGITIAELIAITATKGLSGLEHFAGIPSTLGGALWQNLHFLTPDRKETVCIGDMVESAEILTRHSGEVAKGADSRIPLANKGDSGLRLNRSGQARMTVNQDYFHFSYDYSILHDTHDIVLSATLKLTPEDPKIIKERIQANLQWREEKHPTEAWKKSAGSVFKKIEAFGAGRLIEKVGLKGYKIGNAQISEKHANFIINTGGATAADVRVLILFIQEKVKEALGLELQTEISFVGEF